MNYSRRGDITIKNIGGNIVFQLPSKWARFYYQARQKYISFGAKYNEENLALAEAARLSLIEDLNSSKFNPDLLIKYRHPSKQKKKDFVQVKKYLTLMDLWDKYCEYKKPALSEGSLIHLEREYRNHLSKCCSDFRNQLQIRNDLFKNIESKNVIRRILGHLSKMIIWARKEGLIDENIQDRFVDYQKDIKKENREKKLPKNFQDLDIKVDERVIAYTEDEMNTIIEAYYKRTHQHLNVTAYLIEFLFLTGTRHGEAFALTWNDVNFQKREIYICKQYISKTKKIRPPKNGKNRYFPINRRVVNLLKKIEYLKEFEINRSNLLVFPNKIGEHNHTDLIEQSWRGSYNPEKKIGSRSVIKQLIEEGKLDHYLKPYSTRATFINRQLKAGINYKTVAAWTGHDVKTLIEYYETVDNNAIPV